MEGIERFVVDTAPLREHCFAWMISNHRHAWLKSAVKQDKRYRELFGRELARHGKRSCTTTAVIVELFRQLMEREQDPRRRLVDKTALRRNFVSAWRHCVLACGLKEVHAPVPSFEDEDLVARLGVTDAGLIRYAREILRSGHVPVIVTTDRGLMAAARELLIAARHPDRWTHEPTAYG